VSNLSITSEKARARDLIFPIRVAARRNHRRDVARRPSVAESITLLQALEVVPDARHRRGRRHPLQRVFYLALGAVLAGADSWAAIADWAAVADHDITGGRPPHRRGRGA
jgi:hypothetical protein